MPKATKRVFQAPPKALSLGVFRNAVAKRREMEAAVQARTDARNRVREEARRLAEEQERARQAEIDRKREEELERQREIQREKQRAWEKEQKRLRELEREAERERERELERLREVEREKERQKEKERELERERERESQRVAEALLTEKKAKVALSKRTMENGSKPASIGTVKCTEEVHGTSPEDTPMEDGEDCGASEEGKLAKMDIEAKLAKLAGEKHTLMLQLKQALSAEAVKPGSFDGRPRDGEPSPSGTQPSPSELDALEEGEYRSQSPALQVPPPPPLLPPPPPCLKSQSLPPPPPLPPHLHQTQVAAAKAAAIAAAQAVSSSGATANPMVSAPPQRSPGPRMNGQSISSTKTLHAQARPPGTQGLSSSTGSSSVPVPLPSSLPQAAKANGLPSPSSLLPAQKSSPALSTPGSPSSSPSHGTQTWGLRPAQVEQLQRIQQAAARQQALLGSSKGAVTTQAPGPPHTNGNGAAPQSPLPPHTSSQTASSSAPYSLHNPPHSGTHSAMNPASSSHPTGPGPRSHLQPSMGNGYPVFPSTGKSGHGVSPSGGPGWIPGSPWQLQKSNSSGSNGGGNGLGNTRR